MCSCKWHQWLNHDITCAQGLKPYQNVLIRVSVAIILLLSLLLLLLITQWHQGECRTSDAAVKDIQPEEGVELSHQQDPQEMRKAQVSHSRSRLRQGVATCPFPMSKESVDENNRLMHLKPPRT
nr:PREDICTED: leukocyte immunoglobulin-like receptor subfamily B member 4 isoform X2 [Equus przewalskii]